MVDASINDIAIMSILLIVHLIAIIFTYKVGKILNSKSWRFIMIAFILFLFGGILNFLDLFEILSYDNPLIIIISRIYLPILCWILIGIGMARMYYSIRTSMHLERKLKSSMKKDKKK